MNIKKALKNLIPFSSFNNIRKSLKPSEKFSEPIDQSNVDELKDLFVELCDEFGFKINDIGYWSNGLLPTLLDGDVINTIVCGYSNINLGGSEDYDYAFFGIRMFSDDSSIEDMKPFMGEIYDRILSMGYRCSMRTFMSGDKVIIIYKIGRDSRLYNMSNL